MKRGYTIIPENEVLAESVRGTAQAHSGLPKTGVYIPNYRGVNQSLSNPAGQGRISFLSALANMGAKYVEEQQSLYDNMEISQSISNVDLSYKQESEKFLNSNPSGKGYTEYITSKYDEITSLALAQSSNVNVQNKLQQIFNIRKADISNNAFQAEKQMYTGYAISTVESNLNSTINALTLNPSQVSSLSVEYNQQVESMQNILSASEFEKFRAQKQETFLYSYGLGLIKNNPVDAISLVAGSEFQKGLSPKLFNNLQKQAELELKHQQYKANESEIMLQKAIAHEHLSTFHKMQVGIDLGSVSEGDIVASDLEDVYKHKLLKQLNNYHSKKTKENEVNTLIDECIKNNVNNFNLTPNDKSKYLNQYFSNEDEKRLASGEKVQTICEKIHFLQEHQIVFDQPYLPIKNEIFNTIHFSNEPDKIMDACIALSDTNIPAIKGVDQNLIDFANLAVTSFVGTKKLDEVIKLRDTFLFKDKNPSFIKEFKKINTEVFNSTYDEDDKINKVLNNIYDSDVANTKNYRGKNWFLFTKDFESPDKQLLNNMIYNTFKRTYIQTGSETIAQSIAAKQVGNIVKYNQLSKRYEINPPTPQNTGLSEEKIEQIFYKFLSKIAKENNTESVNDTIRIPNPDGSKVDKKIYLESVDLMSPRYSFYYLEDEDNPLSREYLYDSKGGKYILKIGG